MIPFCRKQLKSINNNSMDDIVNKNKFKKIKNSSK